MRPSAHSLLASIGATLMSASSRRTVIGQNDKKYSPPACRDHAFTRELDRAIRIADSKYVR